MNLKRLLGSLLEHQVQFLVIGAWALAAYGYKRYTGDIDIFIKPTPANVKRIMRALQAIGYDLIQDATIKMFLTTKVLIRQYVLETDIRPFVKGVTSFDRVWKNRLETKIEGLGVFVPSLEDMIKMKKADGRSKDKLDLIELRKIKKYQATTSNPQSKIRNPK